MTTRRNEPAGCRRHVPEGHRPDGVVYADTMTWEDFSALRDAIGVHTFALTVDAAADRAASVVVGPFLAQCLAHPRNRDIALEVAAAMRLGVPLSVARGRGCRARRGLLGTGRLRRPLTCLIEHAARGVGIRRGFHTILL